MRQGQGQGGGAERGHLHAGLGCGATWGRLPSLGAWQRVPTLGWASSPEHSDFPVCCTEGVQPENCPGDSKQGGRTPSIPDSGWIQLALRRIPYPSRERPSLVQSSWGREASAEAPGKGEREGGRED